MEKQLDIFDQINDVLDVDDTPEGVVTLEEARQYVKKGRDAGVTCPCCKQLAKVYKRQIHSTIAKMLIRTYLLWKNNSFPDSYFHLSAVLDGISSTGINDFSKLLYWGLIEEKPKDEDNEKIRTSGYWRITQKGIGFVRGELSVPKYAMTYDNEVLFFKEPLVKIIDCLNKRFNYDELMNEKI